MTVFPRSRRLGLLVATTLVVAPVLAGCSSDGDNGENATDAGASTSSAPSSTPSTDAPTEDPTGPGSGAATGGADTVAVPVYFVGSTPQGQRLYREFRQVSSADPVAEALALLTAGDALDPDYSTDLPAGTFGDVTDDATIVVPLPDASWTTRPAGMTARQAKLAVQQIVYTVQGVLQRRGNVTFTVDGNSSPVLGIDAAVGVRAAKDLNVLALVSVTTPEQGATVSGTFTASGVASSFEGTVPWEIRAADGTVAKKGFATAEGYIDKLYPWTTDVDVSDLAPGDYVFAATTDDPSDGEGPGPTEDTKAMTIS